MIKIFKLTLAANEVREVSLQGEYFELRTAASAIDVELLDRSGGVVSLIEQAQESDYVRPGRYETVRITNGATAQAVQFWYGSGDAGSRRFSGSVSGTVNIGNTSGAFTQAQATVTNASGQLLAANAARRYLLIQNNDTSGDIYVTLDGTAATTAKGLKIAAGGALELQGYAPTGAINAIGSLATQSNVVTVEG